MTDSLFVRFLIIANILGAAYGFMFYYGQQLLSTSAILVIFVADCPLHALLMGVALFLSTRGFRSDAFYSLCAAGAVKYGLWTVFVLSYYSSFYFVPNLAILYSVLFVSHLVLLAEPVLLRGHFSATPASLLPAAAWLLLNDVSDYLFSTHPPLPSTAISFMSAATVSMTALSLAAVYIVFRLPSSPPSLLKGRPSSCPS